VTTQIQTSDKADELLILRCLLGERPAFEALIHRWSGPLRRHLQRVMGDQDVADDLLQDVWLRVLQGLARLQDPSRFRSWLFSIAHRAVMDHLRGRYALGHEADVDSQDLASDVPDEEQVQAHIDIERGLNLLPVTEREVVTLFHLEQLSLSEVAASLSIPVGTVKSRLHRARSLLRLALSEKDPTS
jgi:RNA polymerase sigma-70 factor (ECF subfamily)